MKRRSWIFGGSVLLLATLNIWRWTASPSTTSSAPDPASAAPRGSNENLVVRAASVSGIPPTPLRDLFQAKTEASSRPRVAVRVLPPPKTPEQIAEELARAELARIKLLGVVFRGDQGEAFLLANGASVAARTGARVGNHFVIERITPEIVDVRDPDTQVSGQLQLTGH